MSDAATTTAPAPGQPGREPSWLTSLWALIQSEMSSYPGRPLLVLRIVLACTAVMFAIIVFRIPGGVLGAYYPILVSRDSLKSTRRSALWITAACTAGAVEVVLGAMLFVGSPFLHLIWVWGTLFLAFYLISSLKVYEVALALGLFFTNTITIWDQPISADLRLRQTLFTLMVIFIGCGASIVVEYLLARTHAPDAVLGGIQERLELTGNVLRGYLEDRPDWEKQLHLVHRYSARGTATLRGFIAEAGYSFEQQQRLSTALSLSGRLIDLTATLMETTELPTVADRELCAAVSRNLLILSTNLLRQEIPDWIDLDDRFETHAPLLAEIERTVELLAESLSQPMWSNPAHAPARAASKSSSGIFVASSQKTHVRFAIRGALSAIVCYMFYMSVGWTALSASVATCILTALPITGASRHKQLLRFAGIVLGACALGFTAQMLILPQIDSILSYTLLFAAVTFIGAWIGTSSPRIAYAGVQIVLAYELVNLNRFSINPSLVPARDTVLGIALGIGAMWLIFDHLWATSSVDSLRPMLSSTIRQIARLSEIAQPAQLEQQTSEIMRRFEKLRALVEASFFEAFPKAPPDEQLLERAKDYLPQLRAALLIRTGLIHHQGSSSSQCQPDLVVQVQQRSSLLLEEIAQQVESNSFPSSQALDPADRSLLNRLKVGAELARQGEVDCDLTELRLCSSLLNVVHHLHGSHVSALEPLPSR
ncbi:MAG TPA: FUSC family protein [Edaphobacter sp.]|nr:FUSC family protein [Edaphobacter sp.]